MWRNFVDILDFCYLHKNLIELKKGTFYDSRATTIIIFLYYLFLEGGVALSSAVYSPRFIIKGSLFYNYKMKLLLEGWPRDRNSVRTKTIFQVLNTEWERDSTQWCASPEFQLNDKITVGWDQQPAWQGDGANRTLSQLTQRYETLPLITEYATK